MVGQQLGNSADPGAHHGTTTGYRFHHHVGASFGMAGQAEYIRGRHPGGHLFAIAAPRQQDPVRETRLPDKLLDLRQVAALAHANQEQLRIFRRQLPKGEQQLGHALGGRQPAHEEDDLPAGRDPQLQARRSRFAVMEDGMAAPVGNGARPMGRHAHLDDPAPQVLADGQHEIGRVDRAAHQPAGDGIADAPQIGSAGGYDYRLAEPAGNLDGAVAFRVKPVVQDQIGIQLLQIGQDPARTERAIQGPAENRNGRILDIPGVDTLRAIAWIHPVVSVPGDEQRRIHGYRTDHLDIGMPLHVDHRLIDGVPPIGLFFDGEQGRDHGDQRHIRSVRRGGGGRAARTAPAWPRR